MTDYDNTNTGALFVNEKKRPGKEDADRNGSLNVEGVEFWINGWLKKSQAGKQYLSLSVKRKEEAASKARSVDVDDEPIPF